MSEIEDPAWVRALGFVLAAAVASYGSVGLLLAIGGWYRPLLAFGLGTLVLVGLCMSARPLLPPQGTVSRSAWVCALLAVAAILAITVWNVSHADQHVFVNRDGGTYLVAGKWIASHGTLEVKPFVGPFSSSTAVSVGSAGMSVQGRHLDFTLAHLVPVLLAEGNNIGGDGLMFATVPILGGVALLAFYLFSRRLLRSPFAALLATLCLGFLMPQISFSRDSTTEIAIQVLLFSALWLFCDRRTLRCRTTAFTAGFFLGLIEAVHIDGLAFLVGLPFAVALIWARADAGDRERFGRAIWFCALGVATGLALGFLDLISRSAAYVNTLGSKFDDLVAVVVIAFASVLVVAGGRRQLHRLAGARARFERARPTIARGSAALVLVGGFGAWLIRPHIQHAHGRPLLVVRAVQQLDHLTIDPTRRYFELSMVWASWYIGPITLALAIVGAAYAIRSSVRGSLGSSAGISGLILGPPALLYLWRPSVTPDQIWAARRFLPAVFPILLLAAFGLLCVILRRDTGPWTYATRAVAVTLALAAVAFPLYTIENVSQMTEQRGTLAVVRDTCRVIGGHAAVVIPQDVSGATFLYGPQTLRSFCDVPVVVMHSGVKSRVLSRPTLGKLDPKALRELARQWERQHRKLYVVADRAGLIAELFPGVAVTVVGPGSNAHLLVQTLTKRPNGYHTERLSLAIAAVPLP